jgi:tRNA(Ile)-lysidine synthase
VGPHPAVAAIRHAVRDALAGLAAGDLAAGDPVAEDPVAEDPAAGDLAPAGPVLVACSGGADSLALAAALAFEARRAGLTAGGITIDHGLQAGSAAQAARVVTVLEGLGLDPVLSAVVDVTGRARVNDAAGVPAPAGEPGVPAPPGVPGAAGPPGSYQGPEAAARTARYAALDRAAERAGGWIMLGHTLDDQAETVLLGLARGSGARSLAGMAPVAGRYLRPLLGIRRAQTRAACAALGLQPWDDPHNEDPAFTRVRVRQLMPALTEALGPGVPEALARTAGLLRADAEVLDSLAEAEAAQLGGTAAALAEGWQAAALASLPAAIRHRLLRAAALAAGCPAGALSQRHIASLNQLVTGWRGQRWADLPGGVRCARQYGRLLFTRPGGPGVAPGARTGAQSEDAGGRE